MRNALISGPWCVAAILIGALWPAVQASARNVIIEPPAFGLYDPFLSIPTDTWGEIIVDCAVPMTYVLSLGRRAGDGGGRALRSGSGVLAYELYADPARSVIWGDRRGLTQTVQGTGLRATYTIFARIFAGQNAPVGFYADSVVVGIVH